MASEESRAQMSKQRGQVAAGMKPGPERQAFIARQGTEEAKGKQDLPALGEEAFRQRNIQAAGSYRSGGQVVKDGVYKLHKGETVVPNQMIAHGKNGNMIRRGSAAMSAHDHDREEC